jgi:hypothetical protein
MDGARIAWTALDQFVSFFNVTTPLQFRPKMTLAQSATPAGDAQERTGARDGRRMRQNAHIQG